MTPGLQALRTRVRQAPDGPLLTDARGEISAAEVLERVELLAEQLRIEARGTIGLFCDNSADWVVADLACQSLAACLVPIPTFFSNQQVRHVVAAAGIGTLLVDAEGLLRATRLFGIDARASIQTRTSLSLCKLPLADIVDMPPGTGKITFTSGSTGQPKGVCLSTEQCYRVAESLASAIDVAHPRHLSVLPLSTLLENIGGVYMPLLTEGSCLVYPLESLGLQGSSGVQARTLIDAIARLRPDTMILVPQLLALLDAAVAGGWRAPDSLRFVAVGGGRVPGAVIRRLRTAGLPVYEGYGLSESASVVSLNTPQHDRAGSCGKVLPHCQVRAEAGELVVSGNSFLGYLDDRASWGTAAVRTGDLGILSNDGYLTVTGRAKNVLISSFGRNISPEWVESELLASGALSQAIVLGDGRQYCTALLYADPDKSNDAALQSMIDDVNANLPDYARIRAWARLSQPFSVAQQTLTDNGRLRREAICQRYAAEIDALYRPTQETPPA